MSLVYIIGKIIDFILQCKIHYHPKLDKFGYYFEPHSEKEKIYLHLRGLDLDVQSSTDNIVNATQIKISLI